MQNQRAPDAAQRGPNPGLIAAGVIGGAAFIGLLLMLVLFIGPSGTTGHSRGFNEMRQARDVAQAITRYEIQKGVPLPLDGWRETLVVDGLIGPEAFESRRPEAPTPAFFYVPEGVLGTTNDSGNVLRVFLHPDTFDDIGVVVDTEGLSDFPTKRALDEMLSRMRNSDGTPFAPHLD